MRYINVIVFHPLLHSSIMRYINVIVFHPLLHDLTARLNDIEGTKVSSKNLKENNSNL